MEMRPLTVPGPLGAVELRHLRSFLVIADSETLTQAAARLGISQPSLSAQLTFLEEHLGARLFVRGRNGVGITADGRRLRDSVLGPVTALHACLLEFGSEGLPVDVVAPADLGPRLRGAVQEALLVRFPGRDLQWQELPSRQRAEAFRGQAAQALVEWGPLTGVEGMLVEGRTLGLLMSVDSPLARLNAVSGNDLVGHRVAYVEGQDQLLIENTWSGLFSNGWSPRLGVGAVSGPEDLITQSRTVLVAPEPEVEDPRLTWRPFVVPFPERAWVTIG